MAPPSKWTREEVEALISAYSERRCLYASDDSCYRDKRARSDASTALANALAPLKPNVTAIDCLRLFYSLRSKYVAEQRKIEASPSYAPSLWYFPKMTFLKNYIERPRKRRRSTQDGSTSFDNDNKFQSMKSGEAFWGDEEERRLVCDGGVLCCLCLRSDEPEKNKEEDCRLLSVDSALSDDRKYSYRRILHECFRIETASTGSFLVCHDCRSLLRRTHLFFLRIKTAQLELRPTHVSDEKPTVYDNKRSTPVTIKVENPDIDENSFEYSVANDVVIKKDTGNFGEADPKDCKFVDGKEDRFFTKTVEPKSGRLEKGKGKSESKRGDEMPREVSGEERACYLCDAAFATHKRLLEHLNVHFPNSICDVCGKPFKLRRLMLAHRAAKHSRRSFACDLCPQPRAFKTREYLHNHRREVHGVGGDPRRSACPKCPERFKSHHARLRHLIEAHGERPPHYECGTCARRFKFHTGLNAHVKRFHLNVKKHACDACGDRFFSKYALDMHALKHTGAKDFECDRCGKRFARKSTLVQHTKSHDNVRDHVCAVCDKAFVQKCTLVGHMKVHDKSRGEPQK